jgi:hypothetical protein
MDELQARGLFSALLNITLVAIIFLLSRFLEINRRGIWTLDPHCVTLARLAVSVRSQSIIQFYIISRLIKIKLSFLRFLAFSMLSKCPKTCKIRICIISVFMALQPDSFWPNPAYNNLYRKVLFKLYKTIRFDPF